MPSLTKVTGMATDCPGAALSDPTVRLGELHADCANSTPVSSTDHVEIILNIRIALPLFRPTRANRHDVN